MTIIYLALLKLKFVFYLFSVCTLYLQVIYLEGTYLQDGRQGGTRTRNPRFRKPMLYPIELLAQCYC